jgi:uncharacterized protein Yka (UPF0111/DUF47 family)
MKLLPREERFFEDFQKQADIVLEAARTLNTAVKAGHSELERAAQTILKLENNGDELISGIMTRLNKTFITPLDPEDIHSLATHIEDVLDFIEEAAHNIAAHGVSPIPEAVVQLSALLEKQALALHKAIAALAAGQPVLAHCIEMHSLESEGDRIFRAAITELFKKETDAILIMKLKEVYENLEAATDRCEDVAVALQEILIKNG